MPLTLAEKLEQNVRYWSDFNALRYHPKSVVELPHILRKQDEEPLSFYQQGEELIQGMPELVFNIYRYT